MEPLTLYYIIYVSTICGPNGLSHWLIDRRGDSRGRFDGRRRLKERAAAAAAAAATAARVAWACGRTGGEQPRI